MKRTISVFAALPLCAVLCAQNINQSVQVTNDYVSRFSDYQKLGGGLQVPDSLYRFDYDFDYSVFETPYRGSYEFAPYRIRVTPEPRPLDAGSLYLRAGAGYSFRPQFALAWQPVQKEKSAAGVTAGLEGYSGRYRTPGAMRVSGADLPAAVSGHDLSARFAVNGRHLARTLRLSGELGYEGLFAGRGRIGAADAPGAKDAFRSAFNVLSLGGRIQSRERPGDQLFFDIGARYRFGSDSYLSGNRAVENDLQFDLSAGPVLQRKYGFLIDAVFRMDNVNGYYYQGSLPAGIEQGASRYDRSGKSYLASRMAMLGSLRPHLAFSFGEFRLDAGLRLDYSSTIVAAQNPVPVFSLAPDVSLRLALPAAEMELFAAVVGGQSVQSLYDTKQANHFSFRSDAAGTLARERLRVCAGVEGHRGSRLQYALEAGFVSWSGRQLPAWLEVVRADYRSAYARARLSWRDERLAVDGAVAYEHAEFSEACPVFAPPAFTADVQGVYNWRRRAFAGAFLRAASERTWQEGNDPMPGYVDFGLTGEACVTRRLNAWAEVGNLFGMAIERAPGFIERGPYITVGVSLKL